MKKIASLFCIGLIFWTQSATNALAYTPFATELDPNFNDTIDINTGTDNATSPNDLKNLNQNNANSPSNTTSPNQSTSTKSLTEIVLPSEDTIFGQENNGINLPSGDALTEVVPAIVSNFFYVIGLLIFVALIYAGVLLVIGRGNEENTEKAKQILNAGALALALVVLGYAIVYGISTIQFNNDPQSQLDNVYTDGQLSPK